MYELASEIPDAQVVLALPPEELAGVLLFFIKARPAGIAGVNIYDPPGELEQSQIGRAAPYGAKVNQVAAAVAEALAWLEGQALLVPAPGTNGAHGWRLPSRRAGAMADKPDFDKYRTARLLPREVLHPAISDAVWLSFVRGEYDVAVFQAMRQVEIATRDATGADAELQGVKLARRAFNPENGPLTEADAEAGERQGMMDLFAGALGALKNPHSHRVVSFDSPAEAVSVVLFASQLLRIIDKRRR